MKVRPIRVEGDVAYVPLTKGYEAVIDAADVHLVVGYNWFADTSRSSVYAQRTVNTGSRPGSIKMHRLILGCPDGFFVDHKDGNGLNNRRSNLRIATVAENNRNSKFRKNNTSGYKGVSFHKSSGKWHAVIWVDSKPIFLGAYNSPELAHIAYVKASYEIHGEFGRVA